MIKCFFNECLDFLQFVKKMHRQERVVEEVKLFLKPHFNKKTLTKDEYKDILRRAVPKVSGNICLTNLKIHQKGQ